MKRPSRVELYQEICKKVGMVPKSVIGYFSRREMMEILLWINAEKTSSVTGKGSEECRQKKGR